MTRNLNRRRFLKGAAAAGAGLVAAPYFVPSRAFGANERIVLGIIGSGGRGRGVMDHFIQRDVAFAAVCDVYEPNLQKGLEMAKRNASQVTAYDGDYRKLLEQKDLDGVLIATPEHQHCVQLIDSVQAGKDAYCEKPMSHSIAEGNKMVRECAKTDRIVQIGMQRRSSPVVRKGKEIIDSGVLGDVHFVRVKWNWQWVRVLNNSPLEGKLNVPLFIRPAKRVKLEPMMFREWRYFWKFSGGNITDQGTHLMDVVQWYMGKEKEPMTPRMAECFGEVYKMTGSETPDVFTSIYEYDGFLVNWTLDYASQYQDGWSIEFLGNKAAMAVDNVGLRVYDEPWKGDPNDTLRSAKKPVIVEEGQLGTMEHTDNFLECMKSRKEPNAPPKIGHLAVCGPHLANVAFHKKRRAYMNEAVTRVSTREWLV